ncbi:hypothetical protein [Nonomuraea sp. NPDC052265]|uniref:hypothetical protein n=1 Tax=Nonomuraea sp. NPDC052265 TaxID=3364374 RepID=UPI0037CA7359
MSLVAVVLLVLVVVALGMRSMNRRESSLPPERLKEMAEKEEMTHARSTDEFAAHEPRMANFSPDFSPIDEVKQKPVRTGQRGRRGVDEWGNPTTDNEDEEFWANIRSDAEEGGFGAGGTVAARKGAARPVEREQPAERRERPAERRERPAKPQPVAAAADPNAATVQAPLPQRQPAAAANLADLVEPARRPVPSASDMADQRTVTFAAPTPDVLSLLGGGAQPVVPASRPEALPASGAHPAVPAAGGSGSYPASPSYPATAGGGYSGVTSSGSFPVAPVTPIHGAPTSDPFPAYTNAAGNVADPLETTWTGTPAAATSGSWPAASPDILDDPSPTSYGGPASSWPAFVEQPAATGSPAAAFPASYEVRPGWAVADDAGAPITGPSPATGTPTIPARAVSAYDDVLSAPPATPQPSSAAYETGDFAAGPGPAWPEPPSGTANWPTYGGQSQGSAAPAQGDKGGGRRRAPEQDYNDYYR